MMSFTMIKKTLSSFAAASSTLFSRIGKLGSVRVAHPVKVDDVLLTPEPTSYVAMFYLQLARTNIMISTVNTSATESPFAVEEVTTQPLVGDIPSDAQASPLIDYKYVPLILIAKIPQRLTLSLRSPILPSISVSFSWSAVLTDSTKFAATVECTVPSLIITSPSTATIEADASEPNPFYLRPDGDFLTSQELRELAEIDFDDDGSQPPMILASALPLLSLAAIADENETAAATASVAPEHKHKLATIVEADESSDAPESSISRFVSSLSSWFIVVDSAYSLLASIPSSWSALLADEAIVPLSSQPELAM
jgi:hypothetical protein